MTPVGPELVGVAVLSGDRRPFRRATRGLPGAGRAAGRRAGRVGPRGRAAAPADQPPGGRPGAAGRRRRRLRRRAHRRGHRGVAGLRPVAGRLRGRRSARGLRAALATGLAPVPGADLARCSGRAVGRPCAARWCLPRSGFRGCSPGRLGSWPGESIRPRRGTLQHRSTMASDGGRMLAADRRGTARPTWRSGAPGFLPSSRRRSPARVAACCCRTARRRTTGRPDRRPARQTDRPVPSPRRGAVSSARATSTSSPAAMPGARPVLGTDRKHELSAHRSHAAAIAVAVVERDGDGRLLARDPASATTSAGTSNPVAVLPESSKVPRNFMLGSMQRCTGRSTVEARRRGVRTGCSPRSG